MKSVAIRFDPLHHLDNGVRVRGEHLPLVGHDLFVVFALHAVEHHYVLGLDDPVLASVGHRRTVRVIWRESAMSVWELQRNIRSRDPVVRRNPDPQQRDVCEHVKWRVWRVLHS